MAEERSVAARCEAALAQLVGERFNEVGRAALQWFSFGELHEVPRRQGGSRWVGRHALHLQCSWRLRDESSVLIAMGDVFAARVNPEETDDGYDWDARGASWFDVRAVALNERLARDAVTVVGVDVDPVGGFRLSMDHGLVLDVLDVTSFPREHWRVFVTGPAGRHLVVFGRDGQIEEGP